MLPLCKVVVANGSSPLRQLHTPRVYQVDDMQRSMEWSVWVYDVVLEKKKKTGMIYSEQQQKKMDTTKL